MEFSKRRWASLRIAIVCVASSASIAAAADMPAAQTYRKAPVSSVYDWSGFYLGGMIGGSVEKNDTVTPGGEVPTPLRNYAARVIGGGYAGYNAQFSNFVLGVEGDIAGYLGGAAASSAEATIVPGIFATTSSNPKWLGTVTGRAGLALNNWLLYAKAGGAWMGADYTATVQTGAGAVIATQSASATRSGWIAGAGIEYAWSQNWISRLEYNYVDFGTQRIGYTFVGINNADYKTSDHIVKAGLAYKF